MIKILELFGGIGACTKALDKLNIPHEIVDYVEIDKYAVKSFNAINNTNFEPQDICKWDKKIDVDLIMHGSPCQDFSIAGKQAGGDKNSGTRSSLMYETLRIVENLKPKYVIWENVKNLVSKKHIHNFASYIRAMENLGYKNYYKVLNSKYYGIPQNRERVFTISIREDISSDFHFPEKRELKTKLKDMLESNVDEKYYLSSKAIEGRMLTNYKKYKLDDNCINGKDVHPTIMARYDGAPTLLKEKLCNKLIEENKVEEGDVIRHSYSTNRMNNFHKQSINNELSPTLDTRCDCLGIAVKNNTKKGYLIAHPGDGVYTNISNKRGTVQKEMIQTITTFQDKGVVEPDLRIRKLTPLECWRLMGFEDKDFHKAEKINSNAQLYKQAGNSIVVNVLEEILKILLKEEMK